MARYLKIGKESTYGTPVAGAYTIAMVKESLKLDHGYIRSKTIEARDLRRSVGGAKVVSGGWEQYVNYKNIGLILKSLLGDEVKSNPTAGVALHTFTHNALGTLPSLTVRAGLHDVTEKIVEGYGVDSLKLECTPDDFLSAVVDGVGEDLSTGTVDAAPVFNTQAYATVTNTFTLGGSAATPEKLSLIIKNSLKKDHHTIAARTLPRLEATDLEVSGDMDIRFLNTTHLANFLAGTRVKLIAKWQGGVISGAYSYYLQFTVEDIEYDVSDAYVDRQERIVEGLKFTAVKGAGAILTVELQNDDDVSY